MASEPKERLRWLRVQDLFHRARELDPERRPVFLERHCGDDAELRAEVGELLEEALPDGTLDEGAARPAAPEEDLSGSELGDYRLVRIIGAGSMGVIYEARQRYVERSVALKILRRRREVVESGGSPEGYERMSRRFAAEAEVLGLLDHPGIVPIHEMGHETGRSYFTMRLVRGEDLRDLIARIHAGDREWSLHRALGVVLRVCETLAFAHDRDVLHRDLKPSHVMVGDFGEVYIVDWGLARLPGREEVRDIRLREATAETGDDGESVRTVDGDVIGTPAYMPPEQAHGELDRLGVASDVYALGALLYHLLTGRVPFVAPGERPSAHALLERVRSGPPAPVQELAPVVDPALAAICEKAMRREPEERYPGVDHLARDLRAFLENRVVSAHRTGAAAELRKWLQRNRTLAAAGALTLLLLAGWATSLVVIQASKNRALGEAVLETGRERDRAREQAAIATAATAFLDDMFRAVHPLQAQGQVVTVRDALDEAVRRLDGAFPEQPLVEASVRATLGVAYHQLGLNEEAEPHLAWAHGVRSELLGESDPATILSTGEYGVLLRDRGRLAEAEELLRLALDRSADAFGADARETLRTAGHLAQLLFDRARFEEAEVLANGLLDAVRGEGEELLVALEVLGAIRSRQGRYEEAESLFRRQLELDRRLFGEGHPNTLVATTNLSTALDALGRREEALALSTDLVRRLREVFGPRHRNTLMATVNTGTLLCAQGATDEGVDMLLEALVLEGEVLGNDHPETMLTTYNLAEILRRDRRFADAAPLFEELLAWQRELLDEDHADLRRTLHGLADCRMGVNDLAGAADVLLELLPLQERNAGGPLTDAADTAFQLAFCYEQLGWTERLQALHAEREAVGED